MNDYVIVTESCCDLPLNLINKYNIKTIPMSFVLDGKAYKQYSDNRELSLKDFYTTLRSGFYSQTAAVNLMDARDIFEKELKEGKDILYIGFSSALSSNFQSVNMVLEDLREEYPDRIIEIIDSKAATAGLGLIVYYAGKLLADGFSLLENKSRVLNISANINHNFMVDDLNFLKHGGRISATTAVAGTILSIKPVLKINELGEVTLETKTRGRIKGIAHLRTKFEENHKDNDIVFIGHTDNPEEAEKMKLKLQETYPAYNFVVFEIGPIIGSHLGPDAIAIVFLGEGR